MKIGISTASFYPIETEIALEEVGKTGASVTEIFFNATSELKSSFIDILYDIKKHYNIEIASVHPTMSLAESFMFFSAYERRFRDGLDSYSRYSEIAAELGAKYIIMHGGKPNGILSDEEYCEKYMQIKEAALKNGVTVLQENVVRYRSGDIDFLRSIRNILKTDAQFCFDIKQAIRCGYNPTALIDEFYENIRHFHISDHNADLDCLLPFNGNFDFKSFLKNLENKHFSGACVIEVYKNAYKNHDEIFNSYRKLKNTL